jgi:hypothetical protein
VQRAALRKAVRVATYQRDDATTVDQRRPEREDLRAEVTHDEVGRAVLLASSDLRRSLGQSAASAGQRRPREVRALQRLQQRQRARAAVEPRRIRVSPSGRRKRRIRVSPSGRRKRRIRVSPSGRRKRRPSVDVTHA